MHQSHSSSCWLYLLCDSNACNSIRRQHCDFSARRRKQGCKRLETASSEPASLTLPASHVISLPAAHHQSPSCCYAGSSEQAELMVVAPALALASAQGEHLLARWQAAARALTTGRLPASSGLAMSSMRHLASGARQWCWSFPMQQALSWQGSPQRHPPLRCACQCMRSHPSAGSLMLADNGQGFDDGQAVHASLAAWGSSAEAAAPPSRQSSWPQHPLLHLSERCLALAGSSQGFDGEQAAGGSLGACSTPHWRQHAKPPVSP